jgi:L-ascorbate metabolism protein UlaG (beta-lactamase superfamily)
MSRIRKPFLKKGRYKNSEEERHHSFVLTTFGMWLKSVPIKVSYLKNSFDDWFIEHQPSHIPEKPTITWVGHSTFLIQINGINILTDPIFFNLTTVFRRNLPPGIALSNLPPIDIVLISHNHWDHMHGPTLMALKDSILAREGQVLVPDGDEQWFIKRKFNQVQSFDWGKQETVEGVASQAPIKITFLPAWHWSRRGLFDRNKSLWGSWLIETGEHTIYFAGDTAYSDHFSEIGQHAPSIDVALLPIAPGEPKHKMQHTHIDAYEAGQAFLDLQAKTFVPMHWGTFNFGLDKFLTPIENLNQWWQEQNFGDDRNIFILKVGENKEL